jgi:NitT/TauT family transport system ATP-binding protein
MSAIGFSGVTRRFGSYVAVQNIDFEVREGAFVSVVGPSGCGKSTLLNLAAGLIQPTSGAIRIFNQPLTGLNARAGYMFQQDALLPWKTVMDNVMLGLRFRGVDGRAAEAQARDWVVRVGLERFSQAYPSQLSGGMRKRVAMAQSWIVDPAILLMDEPFSALDIHTRHRMEGELLALWTASPKTILFVTHDLEEALAMSDEVIVLSAGPASHIVSRHTVDLARPRDLIDIRTDRQFSDLYSAIWAELREEVLASYARED